MLLRALKRPLGILAFFLSFALGPDGAIAADSAESSGASFAVSVERARSASPVRVYQLEQALYEHLEIVARQIAKSQGRGEDAPVVIEDMARPQRPTLKLAAGQSPRLGEAEAELEILVVENLSQIYSARLDVVLRRIQKRFPGRVSLVHKDFVLPRHSNSLAAAAAARCASEQDKFWEYRALLLAGIDDQTHAGLLSHAKALALDGKAFGDCLAREDIREAALEETTAVRAAGVILPPTVLVGGVYVGGVEPAEAIFDLVERALGIEEDPFATSVESTIDWALSGVLLVPGRRQAMLMRGGSPSGRVLTVGDELEAGVRLVAISEDAVLIDNQGTTERITLKGRAPGRRAGPAPEATRSDRALVQENVIDLFLDLDLQRRVSRRRASMARQLTPAPLDVDGERLLKLTGSEDSELFAALGLQANDVLMRVNDQWVFDGKNSLFDAIEKGAPATIVVMRRGVPYLIDLATPRP